MIDYTILYDLKNGYWHTSGNIIEYSEFQGGGDMTGPIATVPDPEDDGSEEPECWLCGGTKRVEEDCSETGFMECYECGGQANEGDDGRGDIGDSCIMGTGGGTDVSLDKQQ